jgi:hypothetical protein
MDHLDQSKSPLAGLHIMAKRRMGKRLEPVLR